MDIKLAGKLALVTGGSKGLGYAIAERLLAEGAEVVITGRHGNSLRRAQARLRNAGRIHILPCDLSTANGAEAAIAGVESLGVVDILVNNVGCFNVQTFFEIADAACSSMFELNVMSGVRLARALLPAMLTRGHGRVVFIASEQGINPNAKMAHYAMTKAANVSVAHTLAKLTKGTAVTVNSVLTAQTGIGGVEQFPQPAAQLHDVMLDAKQTEQKDSSSSLLERFATPDEIVNIVMFLASPLSSAINGAAIQAGANIVR